MAREAEGDVAVPPNLKALLAARLDQLEQPERSVLERGAVEGELFHRTRCRRSRGRRRCPAARLARPQGADPPRHAGAPGRRRLPFPPPADPRCRLRRPPEGDSRRAARALRRLARGARGRPRRAGRDPRLPPRAGGAVQGGARSARLRARRASGRAARRCGAARAVARRTIEPRDALIVRALELIRPLAST